MWYYLDISCIHNLYHKYSLAMKAIVNLIKGNIEWYCVFIMLIAYHYSL
jgi:hypothetical protein